MGTIPFILWEVMKVLGLVFLGLLAAKAVANLPSPGLGQGTRRLRLVRMALSAVILGLVLLGGRSVGFDVAAQLYAGASQDNLAHGQLSKAYENAMRAVDFRPGVIRYWRTLALAKLAQHQCASLLDDLPAFQSLSGRKLDEEDAYRFAVCDFYLARYDKVIPVTEQLIRRNPWYTAPYILQGMVYVAQKKYPEAERTFQDLLRMFPTHQAAVEGLAHVYFLSGNRARALDVLNQTDKHPFPSEARKRFEALKALYEQ